MKVAHILINGHGGIDPNTGLYTTAPSKMVQFPDGLVVYEGVENREIVKAIQANNSLGIELYNLVPDWQDISRTTRVQRAKALSQKLKAEGKLAVVWEIHLNAFQMNKAQGKEVFTTRGVTKADEMATIWWNEAEKIIPEQVDRADRADGDPDKEKDYDIIFALEKEGIPSILPECYFFDNRKEVDLYATQEGRKRWATVFLNAMQKINELYKNR